MNAEVFHSPKWYVATITQHVRSGPDKAFPVVGQLHMNTCYALTGKSAQWLALSSGGWTHAKRLNEIPLEVAYPNVRWLTVEPMQHADSSGHVHPVAIFDEPSAHASQVGISVPGTAIGVIGEVDGGAWLKLRNRGWIRRHCIAELDLDVPFTDVIWHVPTPPKALSASHTAATITPSALPLAYPSLSAPSITGTCAPPSFAIDPATGASRTTHWGEPPSPFARGSAVAVVGVKDGWLKLRGPGWAPPGSAAVAAGVHAPFPRVQYFVVADGQPPQNVRDSPARAAPVVGLVHPSVPTAAIGMTGGWLRWQCGGWTVASGMVLVSLEEPFDEPRAFSLLQHAPDQNIRAGPASSFTVLGARRHDDSSGGLAHNAPRGGVAGGRFTGPDGAVVPRPTFDPAARGPDGVCEWLAIGLADGWLKWADAGWSDGCAFVPVDLLACAADDAPLAARSAPAGTLTLSAPGTPVRAAGASASGAARDGGGVAGGVVVPETPQRGAPGGDVPNDAPTTTTTTSATPGGHGGANAARHTPARSPPATGGAGADAGGASAGAREGHAADGGAAGEDASQPVEAAGMGAAIGAAIGAGVGAALGAAVGVATPGGRQGAAAATTSGRGGGQGGETPATDRSGAAAHTASAGGGGATTDDSEPAGVDGGLGVTLSVHPMGDGRDADDEHHDGGRGGGAAGRYGGGRRSVARDSDAQPGGAHGGRGADSAASGGRAADLYDGVEMTVEVDDDDVVMGPLDGGAAPAAGRGVYDDGRPPSGAGARALRGMRPPPLSSGGHPNESGDGPRTPTTPRGARARPRRSTAPHDADEAPRSSSGPLAGANARMRFAAGAADDERAPADQWGPGWRREGDRYHSHTSRERERERERGTRPSPRRDAYPVARRDTDAWADGSFDAHHDDGPALRGGSRRRSAARPAPHAALAASASRRGYGPAGDDGGYYGSAGGPQAARGAGDADAFAERYGSLLHGDTREMRTPPRPPAGRRHGGAGGSPRRGDGGGLAGGDERGMSRSPHRDAARWAVVPSPQPPRSPRGRRGDPRDAGPPGGTIGRSLHTAGVTSTRAATSPSRRDGAARTTTTTTTVTTVSGQGYASAYARRSAAASGGGNGGNGRPLSPRRDRSDVRGGGAPPLADWGRGPRPDAMNGDDGRGDRHARDHVRGRDADGGARDYHAAPLAGSGRRWADSDAFPAGNRGGSGRDAHADEGHQAARSGPYRGRHDGVDRGGGYDFARRYPDHHHADPRALSRPYPQMHHQYGGGGGGPTPAAAVSRVAADISSPQPPGSAARYDRWRHRLSSPDGRGWGGVVSGPPLAPFAGSVGGRGPGPYPHPPAPLPPSGHPGQYHQHHHHHHPPAGALSGSWRAPPSASWGSDQRGPPPTRSHVAADDHQWAEDRDRDRGYRGSPPRDAWPARGSGRDARDGDGARGMPMDYAHDHERDYARGDYDAHRGHVVRRAVPRSPRREAAGGAYGAARSHTHTPTRTRRSGSDAFRDTHGADAYASVAASHGRGGAPPGAPPQSPPPGGGGAPPVGPPLYPPPLDWDRERLRERSRGGGDRRERRADDDDFPPRRYRDGGSPRGARYDDAGDGYAGSYTYEREGARRKSRMEVEVSGDGVDGWRRGRAEADGSRRGVSVSPRGKSAASPDHPMWPSRGPRDEAYVWSR